MIGVGKGFRWSCLTGVEFRVTILVTLGSEGEGLDIDLGTDKEIERGDEIGCEMGRGKVVVQIEGRPREGYYEFFQTLIWGNFGFLFLNDF